MKDSCNANSTKLIGVRDEMIFHSLRGSFISSLFEEGYTPAKIAHRSGHCRHKSMETYVNILNVLGKQPQSDILAVDECTSANRNQQDSIVTTSNPVVPNQSIVWSPIPFPGHAGPSFHAVAGNIVHINFNFGNQYGLNNTTGNGAGNCSGNGIGNGSGNASKIALSIILT